MSIGTALVAIKTANAGLNALVGTKFYPESLPQQIVLPAIRYQKISQPKEYSFGVTTVRVTPRVQLDGYAESPEQRSILAAAIRAAFDGYVGAIGGETVRLIIIDNEFETEEKLCTNTQSYRITIDLKVDI